MKNYYWYIDILADTRTALTLLCKYTIFNTSIEYILQKKWKIKTIFIIKKSHNTKLYYIRLNYRFYLQNTVASRLVFQSSSYYILHYVI